MGAREGRFKKEYAAKHVSWKQFAVASPRVESRGKDGIPAFCFRLRRYPGIRCYNPGIARVEFPGRALFAALCVCSTRVPVRVDVAGALRDARRRTRRRRERRFVGLRGNRKYKLKRKLSIYPRSRARARSRYRCRRGAARGRGRRAGGQPSVELARLGSQGSVVSCFDYAVGARISIRGLPQVMLGGN